METSSDGPEPGTYFAPVPGPEVERYWLPSTRAVAIEWARWARLPRYTGLAVDQATLERVADAVMDPANPPPWQPYTAEERKDELPRDVWEAVHGYLIDHPEVDGYVDVRWRDEKRTCVVGIVGDPEPHRAPLARVAGSRVVVERRPAPPQLTDAEAEALVARILADTRDLAKAGLSVENLPGSSYGFDVHVIGGPDEHTVAELIAARYGDAVSVVWLGPHRYVEPLRTFGSWTSTGRWVRVFFSLDPNGEKPGEARVAEESDERVVIALSGREPVSPMRTLLGGFEARAADVELRAPVGDRVVIDASAGVPRPSLAQLGRPAEPAPRLRVVRVKPAPAPRRRRAQVWYQGTSDDAVYEAMLPVDAPLDEDGDPVVIPAVTRDVLDAVCRDLAESGGWAPYAELRLSWADDMLIVDDDDQTVEFVPGPDGLYEVGRLGPAGGRSQWVEVDPPLPDGPIDADTAVDLLSRLQARHPMQDIILKRLDLDALRTARARATEEAVRDALDDEISERTAGQTVMLFLVFLRRLERDTSEDRGFDTAYLGDFAELGREEILGAVPDAGERVLALIRAESDPEARGGLAAALRGLGHEPAIAELVARLDDDHRHVRVQAARALGALRAGEAADALRRALATERWRAEPPPIHERMPMPSEDMAETALRDALRAVTDGQAKPSGS